MEMARLQSDGVHGYDAWFGVQGAVSGAFRVLLLELVLLGGISLRAHLRSAWLQAAQAPELRENRCDGRWTELACWLWTGGVATRMGAPCTF
jgi:hypothetical protein